MNLNKHIWEGWTVQDFIDELQPSLRMIQRGESFYPKLKSKTELKNWCKSNQPYYKKHIPEVVNFFANEFDLK